MNKLILGLTAISLSILVSSAYSATSSGTKIARLGTQDSGIVILYADGGWGSVANNNCSTGTGVLALDSTTDGGRTMLSSVLAATLAERTIIVYTEDSECLSVGGLAPVVKRVDIAN